jgi:holo-[acyl-carrier protein] synthase
MIIGLGEDLVEISRIQRLISEKGDRFLQKCFSASEIELANNHKTDDRRVAYFAKRFAAKEACLKALGTGMRDGLSWHDMSVSNDTLGRPILNVTGGVEDRFLTLVPNDQQPRIHITLADEAGLAKATVIFEATPK